MFQPVMFLDDMPYGLYGVCKREQRILLLGLFALGEKFRHGNFQGFCQ